MTCTPEHGNVNLVHLDPVLNLNQLSVLISDDAFLLFRPQKEVAVNSVQIGSIYVETLSVQNVFFFLCLTYKCGPTQCLYLLLCNFPVFLAVGDFFFLLPFTERRNEAVRLQRDIK